MHEHHIARTLTSEEQHRRMLQTPVPKLVLSLAAPTVASQLISIIYNTADTYFVSRRSELTPLPQTMKQFPAPDTLPVLEAFARFTVRLHEQGICHEDFNQTNILWEYDGTTGSYRFQLIDINRMRFHARPLRPDECMINLRRLSCPAVPFLYILDRYADIRGWDINDTLLRGVFFRLLFGRRQQFKKRFRKRKSAAAGKKQG